MIEEIIYAAIFFLTGIAGLLSSRRDEEDKSFDPLPHSNFDAISKCLLYPSFGLFDFENSFLI